MSRQARVMQQTLPHRIDVVIDVVDFSAFEDGAGEENNARADALPEA